MTSPAKTSSKQRGGRAHSGAGAFWHTVRCQVAAGRIQLLAALADDLSYIVLTPFIGADAAIEIVTEDPRP